ncbi:carbon-nitrogen hydrolase [Pseudomonas aeruginosa]|uniref:nitrilase-related carbon-nitrogen hydrolase n=1 Tax=Pseudomonas aeruginosa TaxID=287 RepID=UPI00071B556D|nr:nitrilase-related carbon-nitrogen hydrolase [Pseudomonas aeruginosa]ELC0917095.1 carbon-nitrogen hydrolase [Pseudomonas aeruginosa]ELG7942268.1 carbon-nitrogen hydrolase [Pseudomonas aeruginosa]ELJ2242827.1 carbon-nitrogen hydrolase [Pseudomonas aeruginosa]KSJ85872.1 carbon-nitrogen hydrolase [Pseudomonas aeruginosa]MBM2499763.1 carbon-nitrogen hydrolase [Pseudomonas aeruginosa]
MAKVTVACCQIAPRIGAQEHNLRLAERAIREAARRGANVVVLPELAASGYVFADRGEALALAETRDGPSLGLWKALAGELDLVIVGGFCERLDPQRVANSAALSGAQLLCAPVNWPAAPRPEGERPAEVVRVQANASVNRLFIAACDRCGQERGVDWVGGSVIVDADGYPLDGPLQGEAGMLLARLDLAEADEKRISAHNHVHRDRRPELY